MIDMLPFHREIIAEALDGMIVQAEASIRFLDRGEDAYAQASLRRAAHFFRHAANQMNEMAEVEKPSASVREAA